MVQQSSFQTFRRFGICSFQFEFCNKIVNKSEFLKIINLYLSSHLPQKAPLIFSNEPGLRSGFSYPNSKIFLESFFLTNLLNLVFRQTRFLTQGCMFSEVFQNPNGSKSLSKLRSEFQLELLLDGGILLLPFSWLKSDQKFVAYPFYFHEFFSSFTVYSLFWFAGGENQSYRD